MTDLTDKSITLRDAIHLVMILVWRYSLQYSGIRLFWLSILFGILLMNTLIPSVRSTVIQATWGVFHFLQWPDVEWWRLLFPCVRYSFIVGLLFMPWWPCWCLMMHSYMQRPFSGVGILTHCSTVPVLTVLCVMRKLYCGCKFMAGNEMLWLLCSGWLYIFKCVWVMGLIWLTGSIVIILLLRDSSFHCVMHCSFDVVWCVTTFCDEVLCSVPFYHFIPPFCSLFFSCGTFVLPISVLSGSLLFYCCCCWCIDILQVISAILVFDDATLCGGAFKPVPEHASVAICDLHSTFFCIACTFWPVLSILLLFAFCLLFLEVLFRYSLRPAVVTNSVFILCIHCHLFCMSGGWGHSFILCGSGGVVICLYILTTSHYILCCPTVHWPTPFLHSCLLYFILLEFWRWNFLLHSCLEVPLLHLLHIPGVPYTLEAALPGCPSHFIPLGLQSLVAILQCRPAILTCLGACSVLWWWRWALVPAVPGP